MVRFEAPIVLCCAEENEVALVTIVDELHREGLAPEVLTGVDSDGALLSTAVDRTPGPALFILCQSDELDRIATRRLSGLFSARKGPHHQLVTVPLAPSRPLASLPPIRAALEELRAMVPDERARQSAAREAETLMRDVVGTTAVSAVRGQASPRTSADQLARELHREMVAAEAHMTRAAPTDPRVERALASQPEPPPELAPDSAGVPVSVDEDDTGMQRAFAFSHESPLPAERGDIPSLEENPLSRVPSFVDLVPTELTPTDERPARRRQAETEAAKAPPSRTRSPGSGTNRVLLFVAIMAIAALAVVAVLHMSSSGPPPASGERVDRGAPPAAESAAGAVTAGRNAAAVPPGNAGELLSAADSDGDTGAAAAGDGTVQHNTPPPPSDREALLIDQAIADGRLRSLDNLLVWPMSKTSMTWTEAHRHCRARRLGTLRRWRLASSAELTRLHRSRMLPAGIYWSRNRNDARDEARALATASGEFAEYLVVESAARPTCLRRR